MKNLTTEITKYTKGFDYLELFLNPLSYAVVEVERGYKHREANINTSSFRIVFVSCVILVVSFFKEVKQ